MRIAKLEYKWLVGIVYTLALFMDLLDMSVTMWQSPPWREISAGATKQSNG